MELPSPEPAPEEMVVKAEHVNEHPSDGKKYQFTIDLMKEGEIMISVFNTDSGITYKTTIKEDGLWFKSNIYIFRGDFSKVLSILRDSLMNDMEIFKHTEYEINETLKVTIDYEDEIYPFTFEIKLPTHVSENGHLEDKVNILEYQVKTWKNRVVLMAVENKMLIERIVTLEENVSTLVVASKPEANIKQIKRVTKGWTIIKEADAFPGENYIPESAATATFAQLGETFDGLLGKCKSYADLDRSIGGFCWARRDTHAVGDEVRGRGWFRSRTINECILNSHNTAGAHRAYSFYIPPGASMELLKQKEEEGFVIEYAPEDITRGMLRRVIES
jgi:hypothetical protein